MRSQSKIESERLRHGADGADFYKSPKNMAQDLNLTVLALRHRLRAAEQGGTMSRNGGRYWRWWNKEDYERDKAILKTKGKRRAGSG